MIELITQRVIELLPTPQAGQKFLWDSDLKGFGVRVGTSGVKSYVVQYRSPDGRLRRMAFARCNLFDVEDARQHARTLLAKATLGIDPADEKNEARRNGSVAEVCDWYLTEAESQRLVGRRRRPIKASTLRMDRSRIERHIKPLLGTRYVKSLRLADIENMQADIAAGKIACGHERWPRPRNHRRKRRRLTCRFDASFGLRTCGPHGCDREQSSAWRSSAAE